VTQRNPHNRARFGVIIPSTNTSVEADYNELAPPGVSFHIARVFINNSIDSDDKAKTTLEQIRTGSAKAVHDVMTCRPDHLILGMSSETFVGGLEGSRALAKKIQEQSGLEVSMGSDATRAALETIGARKVAVLTPYQPVIDAEVERYFVDLGYELVAMKSLRCPTAVSIADVDDNEILAAVDELAAMAEPDVFVQAGTNLSTYRVADEVERRHGKPLIAINVATLWHALRRIGIDDPLVGAGGLFAGQLLTSG
jgi:maleate isomerase